MGRSEGLRYPEREKLVLPEAPRYNALGFSDQNHDGVPPGPERFPAKAGCYAVANPAGHFRGKGLTARALVTET
jgi:hypothetical protein